MNSDKVYVDIPYSNKEDGKSLGAMWDPSKKSWYIPSSASNGDRQKILHRWGRTYIVIPFDEKDAAKEMGAKWDRSQRQWYAPGYLKPSDKKSIVNKWGKKIQRQKPSNKQHRSATTIQKQFRGHTNRRRVRTSKAATQVFERDDLRKLILMHKTASMKPKCHCNPHRHAPASSYKRQYYDMLARTGELKRCDTCKAIYPCKLEGSRCMMRTDSRGSHACSCHPRTEKERNELRKKIAKTFVPWDGVNESKRIYIMAQPMMFTT